MFAADLPGAEFGLRGMITATYLVLTSGWTGSPGEFMIFAWVIQLYHAAWVSAEPDWDDTPAFSSLFLMDDQVIVEPLIGRRLFESVRLCEEGTKETLGEHAQDADEGALETRKLVWVSCMAPRRGASSCRWLR